MGRRLSRVFSVGWLRGWDGPDGGLAGFYCTRLVRQQGSSRKNKAASNDSEQQIDAGHLLYTMCRHWLSLRNS